MHPSKLSDVQWLNFNALDVMRHGLRTDAALKGRQFGLSRALAEQLLGITQREIWSLDGSLGDTSRLLPRGDLAELLQLPVGLAGPLSLARCAPPIGLQ